MGYLSHLTDVEQMALLLSNPSQGSYELLVLNYKIGY